jgi:hypothetical protein
MTFYAYVYRDPSRDMEPFYVGKGKGNRAYQHLMRTGKHPLVQRLQLMKREGVEPDIEIIQAIDEAHAFFLESCLIEMFGRRDLKTGTLHNLTDGGEGTSGAVWSDEVRAKMGAKNKGKVASSETRAKISAVHKGKAMSSETRAKISISSKGKRKSSEAVAKTAAFHRGKKQSPEHIAKVAAALKGGKRSPETIAKIIATIALRKSQKST